MTDITEILTDMAEGKTNIAGDHWSPMFCAEAAHEIEMLRASFDHSFMCDGLKRDKCLTCDLPEGNLIHAN